MLDKPPVSGLVVPCVEAVLEDCRLDVAPFLPLLKRDGFHFPPGLGLVYLVSSEVPPTLLAFLALNQDLPSVVLYGDGGDNLSRLLVCDLKGFVVSLFEFESRGLALDTVGHEVDIVRLGKLAVVFTLVGSVAVQGLDIVAGDFFSVPFTPDSTKVLSAVVAPSISTWVMRLGLPSSSQVSMILVE